MLETPPSTHKPDGEGEISFEQSRHIQYFVHCLKRLPGQYSALDTNRLTLVHFAVQSLDLLGFFDNDDNLVQYNINKQHIIDWIYRLQTLQVPVQPDHDNDNNDDDEIRNKEACITNVHVGGGFKGGSFLGCQKKVSNHYYNQGHIAMTYTAISTLITLGDDLSRLDKEGIIQGLKALQRKDGSFQSLHLGSENDLRFLYCACAISYMLNDWSGVDQSSAVRYIKECRSWDGAIALIPGQESHGGSTFCGVASLALMGKLDEVLDGDDDDDDDDDDVTSSTGAFTYSWREELIQWCVSRQTEGIQGRPNKLEDTCYSFWIGGTLKILGCDQLLDKDALKGFIMDCQTDMGGFSKLRNGLHYCPDLLHSFYSLAWLSVGDSGSGGRDDNHDFLYPIDCVLGISRRRIDDFLERN